MIVVYRRASIAMAAKPDQETLQRKSNELDEVIAMFAETHARTAELRRVLERTCSALKRPSPLLAKSGACISKPLCRRPAPTLIGKLLQACANTSARHRAPGTRCVNRSRRLTHIGAQLGPTQDPPRVAFSSVDEWFIGRGGGSALHADGGLTPRQFTIVAPGAV